MEKKELLPEQVEAIYPLVASIWLEVFVPIIGDQQVAYMLETYQSAEAIRQDILSGTNYFILLVGSQVVGYTAFKETQQEIFISKLYIQANYRGQGYMSEIFDWYEECGRQKKKKLRLTVNKENQRAISVYEHRNFACVGKQTVPIGEGFVMDDYIFEKNVC